MKNFWPFLFIHPVLIRALIKPGSQMKGDSGATDRQAFNLKLFEQPK